MATKYGYTYDYTKTMMMKMLLSKPDRNGGSDVKINISQAMDIIKQIDNLTLATPKIIYLVGWQYLGHDDKYPDFFDVNPALKRDEDATAYDSMLWLMHEAKKYNTIVSFHINFNDAYEDAPSFNDYLSANAFIRKRNGKPHAIERYNGRNCYKVCMKQDWESGLFKRRIDKLLSLYPIKELGTVHVDNFQCYTNYKPYVSIDEMSSYRDKMIGYLREKGVDITTEFTCREDQSLPNTYYIIPRDHHHDQPIRILGKIPAVWWLTYLSNDEIVNISPEQFGGGIIRNGTHDDARRKFVYGNMHGEDVFEQYANNSTAWSDAFTHDYMTIQVPYNFLCGYKRLSIEGKKGKYVMKHEHEVLSYQLGQRITVSDVCIKDGDNLCMPLQHVPNSFVAYSKDGDNREWQLLEAIDGTAEIFEITPHGNKFVKTVEVKSGKIMLNLSPKQSLLISIKQ